MSKKFLLGTTPQASEVEAQYIILFNERGYTWWHWLPGLWLLIAPDHESASTIRDALRASPLFGNARELLVMEIQSGPGQWAGASFPRGASQMGDWLQSVWEKA